MATIIDVARRAGVSVSTVSHVVNATRTVSPETTRLVAEAIAATGYTPNSIARSLARSATNSVGIALSAISNPYFSDIICAIGRECDRLGLMVFLCDTHDDPEHELQVVRGLHQRRVDGVLLAPAATSEQRALDYLRDNRVPCVLVDRAGSPEFDQVCVQNARAMAMVVEHLAGHGHRRIGFVGGQPGFATSLERAEGFRDAVLARGLDDDMALLQVGNGDLDAVTAAAFRLLALPKPPTAIATGNNLATVGTMRALRQAGLRVPDDMALIGFDDFEWADYFEPRLTTIAQPCQEIGRHAASLLMDRIKDYDGKRRTLRLAASLVIRNSCGCR
ncbi:LacI family DNA-binding transcriptional regulator [Telmatospirillum sp.]|uniref:LacI family DNA-binding transcriptional regulator n=1 Tax=Telmatospirillum sp. TaxID=2079197 RepID=UPI002844474F|nr:LacI family DNA-binding transcriptional regulator [Telmatospirillum sp.]MDR3438136.1 LacI family DNA-binding transcriptional regulator [Telmatospirillum sp.]